MVKNAVFLIDAGYLSFVTKFLGKGKHIKFRIEDFAKNVSDKLELTCKEIYFYTAPPYQSSSPTEKENKKKANYDKFISQLKKVKNPLINVREGRCQKINNEYSQKGVDTLITMDLLKLSLDKKFDSIVLMSADTDFVPIIQEIKKDKEIVLVYFTDKQRKSAFTLSNHLWAVCKKKYIVKLEDFY